MIQKFAVTFSILEKKCLILSYYFAVCQWITSCNKRCYDHTCINTFGRICDVNGDVCNNNVKLDKKICPL